MSGITNYQWRVKGEHNGDNMQMHAVPQQEIYATLYKNGCYLVENHQKLDAAGVEAWDTAWITFAKPRI
jgi:hypothetical protein